tara:strand:+ start:1914 stop:2390 length:477 start_codon:yes stop_codon:yes gene_type:complete
MISYSLICSQEHEFEAWFKSSGDYDKQLNSGFLACPICGDVRIRKALMAPAVRSSKKSLNKNVEEFSAKKLEVEKKKDDHINSVAGQEQLKIALRSMRKYIEKNCENVGDNFAKEARDMHNGMSKERGIYGRTSSKEAEELIDEGIEISTIPWVKDDS